GRGESWAAGGAAMGRMFPGGVRDAGAGGAYRGPRSGRVAGRLHCTRRRHMAQIDTITLAEARRVIEAGEAKAAEIGQPMNIAVADAGGNLVAHVRMDGAWIGSVDISINKAFTARAFDISTKDLAAHAQSG